MNECCKRRPEAAVRFVGAAKADLYTIRGHAAPAWPRSCFDGNSFEFSRATTRIIERGFCGSDGRVTAVEKIRSFTSWFGQITKCATRSSGVTTQSLTHAHSLTHSPTHPQTHHHSWPRSLTATVQRRSRDSQLHSLTHSRTHSALTHALTHARTHSLVTGAARARLRN